MAMPLASGGCYLSTSPPNPPETQVFFPAADAADTPLMEMDAGPDRLADAPNDASPPPSTALDSCDAPRPVDLLLVLDDSGSIRDRDELLRDRLMRLVIDLLAPSDRDGDGYVDRPAITDLHAGAVTTSVYVPGPCAEAEDGRLSRGAPGPMDYCREGHDYPPFARFTIGAERPREVAEELLCAAFGPRSGCSLEQPLEAMAKALLPASAPFVFATGSARGARENSGFLREDSVLVVLMITDEDDCSVRDPDALGDGTAEANCELPSDALHAPERYAEALLWLRPDHPERIVFGVVAGVPDALIEDPTAAGAFLSLASRLDTSYGCVSRRPIPAARRLVSVAAALPERSLVGSICDMNEGSLARALVDRITDASCAP